MKKLNSDTDNTELLTPEAFAKIFSDNKRKLIIVAGYGHEKISTWLPVFYAARGEGVFVVNADNFKQSVNINSKQQSVLEYATHSLNNVLLILESIPKMFKKIPKNVLGRIATNRHEETDMIVGFNNVDEVPSQIWQNADYLIMFPHSAKIKKIKLLPFIKVLPQITPVLIDLSKP